MKSLLLKKKKEVRFIGQKLVLQTKKKINYILSCRRHVNIMMSKITQTKSQQIYDK